MKKAAWAVVFMVVVVIGYVAAAPYLTVSNLKTGIVENDAELLSENIDFPVFRQNLKNRFSAAMMRNAGAAFGNNPFTAVASRFASTMVEEVVDSFVTPSGLAKLMAGDKPYRSRPGRGNRPAAESPNRDDLFKNARFSYDSLSRFSIRVPTDTGDEVRFILERDGISWMLVDMVVPI